MDWDNYFLSLARVVALKSKDQSTKVGAVVVGPDHEIRSTGFNGLPRGMADDNAEYQYRPFKYKLFEHAERNAIFNAARFGACLKGCTIYCYWPPCSDCARAIIQAGIIRCVYEVPIEDCPERWHDDMRVAYNMLHECKVSTCTVYSKPLSNPNQPTPNTTKLAGEGTILTASKLCDKCTCSQHSDTCSCPDQTFNQKLGYRLDSIKFPSPSSDTKPDLEPPIKHDINTNGKISQPKFDRETVDAMDMAPKNNHLEGKARPTLLPFDIYSRFLADMNNAQMTDLPFDVFLKYQTKAYDEGVVKYMRESWRKGFPVSIMIDAALRHIIEFFWQKKDEDVFVYLDDNGEEQKVVKHHLTGAIFCLTCILQTIETRPELDDRNDIFCHINKQQQ